MTKFFSIIFRLLYWRVCIVKKQEWYFQHGRKHVYWTFWKSLRSRVKISLFLWQAVVQSCSGFLRNFTKFTGKHLCQILFFNKEIQKVTLAQVFSCEFCEITKNSFTEHVWATAKTNNLFKDKNISLFFIQLIIIM